MKIMIMAIDKLILFIICLAFYLPSRNSVFAVVPIILAITFSSLSSWLERDLPRTLVFAVFALLCLYEPLLIFFLPLLCFDLFAGRTMAVLVLALAPPALHYQVLGTAVIVQLALLAGLAWFMKTRGLHLENVRAQALQTRDSAREMAHVLENKNKELLEKQDYEINLATLNERNRIAREIHDHVGHLLTRAILQLGALMATTASPDVKSSLQDVKNTLGESMDEIRHSLHDLHESSLDLQNELRKIIRGFSYCPVELEYFLEGSPAPGYIYTVLAIVREALSNIARHSGADRAQIILREHPGFYQLIIKDNGRGSGRPGSEIMPDLVNDQDGERGMGLRSMTERIRKLDGQINFSSNQGWTIFATLPKSRN